MGGGGGEINAKPMEDANNNHNDTQQLIGTHNTKKHIISFFLLNSLTAVGA